MSFGSKSRDATKHPELTSDQMAALIEAVTANSKALHHSAAILLDSEEYVQAYLLDHFGVEEISKAHLIYWQWLAVQSGHAPQWDAFWKTFRKHELKTMNALNAGAIDEVTRALQSLREQPSSTRPTPPSPTESAAQLEMLRPLFARLYEAAPTTKQHGRDLHLKRLDATYVDFRVGTIIEPSMAISADDAAEVHAFLARNIDGFGRVWSRRESMMLQAQALGDAPIDMWQRIASEAREAKDTADDP